MKEIERKITRRDFLMLSGAALAATLLVDPVENVIAKGVERVRVDPLRNGEYLTPDEVRTILVEQAGELGEYSEKLFIVDYYREYFNKLSLEAGQGEFDYSRMIGGMISSKDKEVNYDEPWTSFPNGVKIAYLYVFRDATTNTGLLFFRDKNNEVIGLPVEPWDYDPNIRENSPY